MIGLSPALDFWNGGADLATRSARISSLGGGNTEYILIPGGKLPIRPMIRSDTPNTRGKTSQKTRSPNGAEQRPVLP